ncbi:hypothetical protein F1188_00710 [Roseospira marina]|uniref:Transmembrane protein n=1 Tax=Roseospira marina TaxID=140057 RepID=A0A5M6IGH3_9PROT|nr:hypothetical protein [Roseospira marina]KAA5607324.1 hypothetical protein F1188_00710 [Roseospira marina]MBB4312516.1 putative membrane protein [Roseospira marina]MBB5085468.1 putative membrane protein [Roseospira marina]
MSQPLSSDSPITDRDRAARMMVFVLHGLFLVSVPLPFMTPVIGAILAFLTLVIGVALAYTSRLEAPPVWRTHFDEAIRTFWTFLLLQLVGVPLVGVLLIGVIPMTAGYVLLVFRATRGLLRAAKWLGV